MTHAQQVTAPLGSRAGLLSFPPAVRLSDMDTTKILDVLTATPLSGRRLISGPARRRTYCAVGALLHAVGVDDEELLNCRTLHPWELWARYGDTLAGVYGLTRNEVYDFIEETDRARDDAAIRRLLSRILHGLTTA